MPRAVVDEKRKQKVAKVNELIETGLTQVQAVKKVGISMGSYYRWSHKFGTTPTTTDEVFTDAAPMQKTKRNYKRKDTTTKVMAIVGTPEQIADTLRGL